MKFSTFLAEQERESLISSYLDEKGYTFFFEYEKDLYAAEEDSRLIFSKMKTQDEDLPFDWKTEVKFMAVKLIPSLIGDTASRFFNFKNLKDIKNVDREDVIKKISKNKQYNDFRLSK